MQGYIKKIREIAENLLKDNKVDLVVGFRQGTLPMMNEPCVINKPEDAKSLVWDSNCGVNLTTYLTDRKEKIAVVAKGCDSRNINTHIIENKIKRDQLFVIGVPCEGMIDKDKVALAFGEEVLEVLEEEGKVTVKGKDKELAFDRNEVLQNNCAVCVHPNPAVYDELVGELLEEPQGIDRYEDTRAIESMSTEEKWKYFEDLFSDCVRCYACRNACPLCYCPACFVDESRPQWVGKGDDPIDTRTFHFLRAYHCAGRCTDCGSCERACPVGIKMKVLTKKLEKDCLDNFGWEAGLNAEDRPPLDSFDLNDPEEFIK